MDYFGFNLNNYGMDYLSGYNYAPTMNCGFSSWYSMPMNFNNLINPMSFSCNNFQAPIFNFNNFGNNWNNFSFSGGGSTSKNQSYSNGNENTIGNPVNLSNSELRNLKNKHWSQMSDSEMRAVYGSYQRDVTKLYSGTAADLNKYLKGKGVLEGKGQAFIDAQKKYGISAAVLVGICMNESGAGKSKNARNKNNVGGVRIKGSTEFRTFSSVNECIDCMGGFLKRGYVDKSLTKLYQWNAKYCPASDPTDKTGGNSKWARTVEKFASQVEKA